MRDFVLPSAWLAMWRQEADSDCSDDSTWEWSEDEDGEEEHEVEDEERRLFSSKTGTAYKGVFYNSNGAPEGQESSLAEPYMVARRGEELLCCNDCA